MKRGGLLSLAGVFLEPCLRKLAAVLLLLAFFQFTFVTRGALADQPFYQRMDNPLIIVPFLLGLAATVLLCAFSLDGCFTSTQGICTLLTLPMPRYRLLLAPLLACGAAVLLLWGFQLMWILCLYRISCGGALDAGLALAFDHSRLLRMLLPRSVLQGCVTVSFVAVLICGTLHLVLRRVGLGLRDTPLSKLSGDFSVVPTTLFIGYYIGALLVGGSWWEFPGLLAFLYTGMTVFFVISSLRHVYGCRAWDSSREGAGA